MEKKKMCEFLWVFMSFQVNLVGHKSIKIYEFHGWTDLTRTNYVTTEIKTHKGLKNKKTKNNNNKKRLF